MSTVAYKDAVMASDTRAYSGGSSPLGIKAKTKRLEDGTLVGAVSGQPGANERLIRWVSNAWGSRDREEFFEGRENFKDINSYRMIVITPEGEAYLFDDRLYPSGPIICSCYAIGSGAEYALGAMYAGACAVDATFVAAKLDMYSDAPVMARSHAIKDGWTVDARV